MKHDADQALAGLDLTLDFPCPVGPPHPQVMVSLSQLLPGRSPRQHLNQQAAKGPDVRLTAVGRASDDLGEGAGG